MTKISDVDYERKRTRFGACGVMCCSAWQTKALCLVGEPEVKVQHLRKKSKLD